MEPLAVEEHAHKIIVMVRVTGTFDGGPVLFRLDMDLTAGLIHHLKLDFAE